ncbi:DUF2254 domain-containing protein [Georgenia sp. SYP-B2076]|uniref:DUF2254 domain-containing protein n=1 Tax=Georgenia sp. SYP-B2076 TaxID=2495881 RepID=UPI000F8D87C9|nr:DUF2254 domain-containing protein [Georgenia sp. SYP-B2076]
MSAPWGWRARFRARAYFRDSLWVLPLACTVLGAVLGVASARLDAAVETPVGLQYTPGTATTVLTTIAGAMVGLLGLVVTIGVLVVQQATNALSPRFMRLWYRQRLQKVVLGTFAGTFTFAFTNLRRVEDDSVPDLGVTAAGLLCAASLVLLLIYLNNFIQHLRPVAVAALVAAAGEQALAAARRSPSLRPAEDVTLPVGEPVLRIRASRSGAIQALNPRGLLAVARRYECTVVLIHGIGNFVPAGATVVEVHGPGVPNAEDVERCLVQGVERTVEQDPAFALRILVDIAIRALSPAVNDPTTAVQVLDYIESFLQSTAVVPLPGAYALTDDDGAHRVVIPGRRWDQYLELALTEVRQFGAMDVQVCRRLAALLDQLLESVPDERRPAVQRERVELAASVARSFPDPTSRALACQSDRQGIGGADRLQ